MSRPPRVVTEVPEVVLIDLGPSAAWVLGVALLSWAGLAAWLLAGRALHDLRHRGVRATRHRLVPVGEDQPADAHALRARELLASLPARSIEELAADAGMPPWLSGPFAIQAIERKGSASILRAAASHRGVRGRWKRIAALRILGAAGHPDVLPLLQAALLSGDPDLAGAAVGLLGEQRDRGAAQLLVRALCERLHPQSRVAARLDRFPLDVPDLLMPLLGAADPTVRFWGATLLARYGAWPDVVGALAGLETDADASVRKAAVESLGVVGGPVAAETALRLLADPTWFVRAHAARALGDLERDDLAPRVLPLLADREWWVRAAAKDALQAMGPAAAPAVAAFLDHSDRFARNGAAEVLQNLGVLDEISARMARTEAGADEVALLDRASAAGGIIPAARHVRRILPGTADKMRALLAEPRRRESRNQ